MGKLVTPKVYRIGCTTIDDEGMREYLHDTGNDDFYEAIVAARQSGLSDGEILCSFYAKLCYAALTLGKNGNVTRVRDVPDNIRNCFNHGHSSVFEHCFLNFVVHNCSRVFEAELIRHRTGTAFSIQSGRYVRTGEVNLVSDPILEPVRLRIESVQAVIEQEYNTMVQEMGLDEMDDFTEKKKVTSALRRILPEGQAKEVGFSVNIRELRHVVQLRTSHGAEWEIREVFSQVYKLVKDKHPLLFYGAKEEEVDGALEITGMKMQPY